MNISNFEEIIHYLKIRLEYEELIYKDPAHTDYQRGRIAVTKAILWELEKQMIRYNRSFI
ncbi:MAG: hypothetical protein ACTTK0_09910 [Stomatobaculum sp.]